MDFGESKRASEKQSTEEKTRQPLVPADNKNGAARRPRIREVNSRYLSPTPSVASGPKRCPSPNASRASSASTVSAPKRAISAERKRSSRPSSPLTSSQSTPVRDTSAEMILSSKKIVDDNRLSDSLWPSTMRNLSVSFQSDASSVPSSKRGKQVSHTPVVQSSRSSSNITSRHGDALVSRKSTPERKRSPADGKKFSDQVENSKPVDSLHSRLVEQHVWPSRAGGKVSSIALNGSTGSRDKVSKTSPFSHSVTPGPYTRRLSLDGASKSLQKSSSDLLILVSHDDSGKPTVKGCSIDDSSLRSQRPGSSSSDRTLSGNAATRTQFLSTPRLRPPSPSPPASRGVSPSRTKPIPSSRGNSPARVRPSSPSKQTQSSISVLSFFADIKKGKKAASHIEDIHQLRMLYNRHLQWRYANARSDGALLSQKVKAEKLVYSVWRSIAVLLDSVVEKRIHLQHFKLTLTLCSILSNQLIYLDKWASVESDHSKSLTSTIQDLETSTIRVPVTGGARGGIESVKKAISSAAEVMQATVSTLLSMLSQVERTNFLVSELADIAAQERALLDECELGMGTTAAFQVEEYSLRAHVCQQKQPERNGESELLNY